MTVYIGLGSNIDNPVFQLQRAVDWLKKEADIKLSNCSSLYRSKPVGPADQPDFINAVAVIETSLPPTELLSRLQQLEQNAGRIRTRHWGERTLDLDILLWDQRTMSTPSLCIPHPHMTRRAFVLVPLFELAPTLTLPNGSLLKTHWQTCDRESVCYHGSLDNPAASAGS